jgi:prepilin signal peptidase PulO-like enzyme (type II secretory pathway)
VLLIAAAAGLLGELGKRLGGRPLALDAPLAFGPYLALGFWLVWLYGPLVPPALW